VTTKREYGFLGILIQYQISDDILRSFGYGTKNKLVKGLGVFVLHGISFIVFKNFMNKCNKLPDSDKDIQSIVSSFFELLVINIYIYILIRRRPAGLGTSTGLF
jgi:hypothetical protein